MPDRRPILPQIHQRISNNRHELIGGETGYPDGVNTFLEDSFVVLTGGELVAVVSAGVLACGYCQDAAKASAAINPPDAPFGDRHFPHNLDGMIFAISITNGAGAFGVVAGAPVLAAVSVGTRYGIYRETAGVNIGMQFLNSANTTNLFFEVVEKPAIWDGVKQGADMYNPIVFVKIVPAAIQPVN